MTVVFAERHIDSFTGPFGAITRAIVVDQIVVAYKAYVRVTATL